MSIWLRHGEKIEVKPKNGTVYTLEELQRYAGGYIEKVRLKDGRIMVVDEEGWFKDNYLNEAACRMAGRLIAGNALVIEESEIE